MSTGQILAVDDEQGFLDLYVYFLEPMGFKVTCVRNGLEAVEKVTQNAYDLVFMDVHMPVMTGPEAFRKMRKIRPSQKIVIFSSSSDPSFTEEQQTVREGALICLYKPVTIDEIERVLDEHVHKERGQT